MKTKEYDKLMKDYSKVYGSFMLAYHGSPKGRWVYATYGSDDYNELCWDKYRPNHRRIFPDELVIDIDTDDMQLIGAVLDNIIDKLDQLNFSYTVWKNPSGKYHIHLFFPEIKNLPTGRRQQYKEYLLYHIITKDIMELGKIDLAMTKKNHLVRAEYGRYEKNIMYDTHKELIHTKTNGINKIPYLVHKFILLSDSIKTIPKPSYSKSFGNSNTPDCVKQLLSQDFTSLGDGRERALFFLTWWFMKTSHTDEEWTDKLNKFNKYNLNNYASDNFISNKIYHRKKSRDKIFTHKYVHDLLMEVGVNHKCECDRDVCVYK